MELPTDRQQMSRRLNALRNERASWIPHYQQISDVLMPRAGRFLNTEPNRGEKRHNNIIDNSGTRALKILGAGMMSGMTSPARPWFRLAIADRDLMEYYPVKTWLHDVRDIMLDVFQRTNTYRVLHHHYLELGAFGTSASFIGTNLSRLLHHHPMTAGEFMIATDYEDTADTIYREFKRTVAEVVREFGLEQVSPSVRTAYDRGNYDTWVSLVHQVEPRASRDESSPLARNMPYVSNYWEVGQGKNGMGALRQGGLKSFRALVSRWEVTAGDIYGSSPGMEALGDLRALQHEQLRKANAIDYQTRPPIGVPASMKNAEINTLPGGVSYFDANGPQGIKSLWDVRLDLSALREDIMDVRNRINSSFFADLFLMLSTADKDMTATEVAERHEEKLLALGPVLERLHNELLDPLIENAFDMVLDAELVPPPPPELAGQEIVVDFISVLAQAQRAVSTAGVDRFTGNVGVIAQFKPEVLDRLDADYWVDHYSDSLGIDPRLIVPLDKAVMIREARAKAQQAAEQAAMLQQTADTAQKLAQVPTGAAPQNNAATDILSQFQGYNSPSAESY